MKKLRKVLIVLLAVILSVGAVLSAGAAAVKFTDTDGHWAWTGGYIPYLVEKNVLNGYPKSDGTFYFKPDGQVTRAEFIKMLDETFGLTATKAISYSDVKSSDWFCVYFQKAAAQGYILNYGSSCNPNGKITREEAITLLARYLALPSDQKAPSSTFSDYQQISSKYREYVLEAIYAGLIEGYKQNDGTYKFKPANTLTRAESLTILFRAAGCIYNTDSKKRDAGAPAENSVVTKAVTIENQTLSGRTIVSEGASEGVVMFSNCTINGPVYIRGKASVFFVNCKVDEVNLVNKSNVSVLNGTTIGTLNVGSNAGASSVIGDGKIGLITVKPSGFSSTIMPDDYVIYNGVKASLGGRICTGDAIDDSDETYSIETSFATLKYPVKWKNKVSVTTSGNTVSFSSNGTKLFDLTFDTASGDYLGAFVKDGKQHGVYIKSYSIPSGKDELAAMQEDVNVILQNLVDDYGFKFGAVLDEETGETYSITTSFATLKYPLKWKSKVSVTTSGNTVSFSSNGTKLFDLTFDKANGDFIGTYKAGGTDHSVYIKSYSIPSGKDELAAMQEDVNVILQNLVKDYGFKFNI